jgi:hypothetical protein
MNMRLGDPNQTSESSLRQLAVSNTIPDLREQLELRVLEGQRGVSSYFNRK